LKRSQANKKTLTFCITYMKASDLNWTHSPAIQGFLDRATVNGYTILVWTHCSAVDEKLHDPHDPRNRYHVSICTRRADGKANELIAAQGKGEKTDTLDESKEWGVKKLTEVLGRENPNYDYRGSTIVKDAHSQANRPYL
jgi:hypothetical protein